MSGDRTVRISAVIPAYNEAECITTVIQDVAPYVDEIVVVDDASTDNTAVVAEEAGAHRVVRHKVNRGYREAIKSGFTAATGDIVVTLDADGEFAAEDIPRLVAPIVEGQADMVQGHRNRIPRLSERFLNWFANRIAPVGDTGTGFRALRRELASKLVLRGKCICGVLALEAAFQGTRIMDVPVQLRHVRKPRRIAWYHIPQFFYILAWVPRYGLTRFEKAQRRIA